MKTIQFPKTERLFGIYHSSSPGVPKWLSSKESTCQGRRCGRPSSIPGSGRSFGGGNGNPSSILSWKISRTEETGGLHTVHRVAKNQTWLSIEHSTLQWLQLLHILFLFLPLRSAYGILVPQPGIEPRPLAVKKQSPTHWIIRDSHIAYSYSAIFLLL